MNQIRSLVIALTVFVAPGCGSRNGDPEVHSQGSVSSSINRDLENNAEGGASRSLDDGYDFLDKGDFESAITAFTEAIRLDSRSADTYTSRGFCYEKTGNLQHLSLTRGRAPETGEELQTQVAGKNREEAVKNTEAQSAQRTT